MNRKSTLLILMLMVFFLMSCSVLGLKKTPLTPEQDLLMRMESFYLSQTNDYNSMVKQTNLTPAQKEVLQKKRKILIESQPLLKMYGNAVYGGTPVDKAMEQKLLDLLNQLGGKF